MLAAGEARCCLAPPRVGMTGVHQNIELIVLDKKVIIVITGSVHTHAALWMWRSEDAGSRFSPPPLVGTNSGSHLPQQAIHHGAIAMAAWLLLGLLSFLVWVWESSSGTQSWAASPLPTEPSPQPSALFFETGSHVAQARLELNM